MTNSSNQTLRTLVATAYAEHGDPVIAAHAVLARISDDATLYRAITAPLLDAMVRHEVQAVVRQERGSLWSGSSPRSSTVRGLELRAESELMTWRLRGGLLMSDATGNDLIDNAVFYEAQAMTEMARAKWLRLIRSELSSATAKVQDELREADLRRLQKKALKECGGDHGLVDTQSTGVAAAAV